MQNVIFQILNETNQTMSLHVLHIRFGSQDFVAQYCVFMCWVVLAQYWHSHFHKQWHLHNISRSFSQKVETLCLKPGLASIVSCRSLLTQDGLVLGNTNNNR